MSFVMKNEVKKLHKEYPNLNFEHISEEYEEEVLEAIRVSGFNGNPEFELQLADEDQVAKFRALPVKQLYILKDSIGIYHNNSFEVLLRHVDLINRVRNPFETNKIELEMAYTRQDLKIRIELGTESNLLIKFLSLARTIRPGTKPTLITIEGFISKNLDNISADCKNILNSVLFDLDYNYNVMLEPISTNSFKIRKLKSRLSEAKGTKPKFVYKSYIPELIEYYRIAHRVDYLPFKYLCYFHIVEYFLDKSAYIVVSQKIKEMLYKPDFDIKIDHYVLQAINIFKKENDKFTTDKNKINRVLTQFIDQEEFAKILEQTEMKDYFLQESILSCSKELKLSGMDFAKQNQFIDTLTNRIYSMRCAIVHSNPDFDDKKAVPFLPTPENLEKLDKELQIIREVAKAIILKSVQSAPYISSLQ